MKSISYAVSIAVLTIVSSLASQTSVAQDSWTDSISLKGDIRPRYEAIDEDGEEDRARGRFRIRLGLTADVNDKVKAIVQLASGGDNPVSTNQTFDGGFTRKDVGLDLAYVDWTPKDNMHVFAGKMKNPLHRAGGHALIWDSDLNPEGLALDYEAGMFSGTIGSFAVEERSSADDSLLLSVQGRVNFDFEQAGHLNIGVGYHDYSETVGNTPFYNGNGKGNSVDASGNLLFDYNQVEVFAEYATSIGNYPLSVFTNYVENTEVSVNDTGYAFGAQIGKAGEPGTWQASWAYQELEADAVIATFTDSDFGGGGTDAKGHTIKGKYALADNWAVGGTLFLNEVDLASGTPHDYTRLQLDLEFKF